MSSKGPPPPPPSRRKHKRYDFVAQVQIPLVGEVLILTLVNISAGGVLLKFDDNEMPDLTLGTVIQVSLDAIETESDEMISLNGDAEVVRVASDDAKQAPTMALMWSSADAAFARDLARILELAAAAQPKSSASA